MCGIFIVIDKKSQPVNLKKCKNALREMQRRGPDWSFYKTPEKNTALLWPKNFIFILKRVTWSAQAEPNWRRAAGPRAYF